MTESRVARWGAAATLAAGLGLGTLPAAAQDVVRPEELPGWSLVPSVRMIGLYEDNVLFASGSASQGKFGLVTPALETRYRGPLGSFDFGYSLDHELLSPDVKGLQNVLGRHLVVSSFESKPVERTAIRGRTQYLMTERPEEVLEQAGLVIGERRTRSFLGALDVDRNVSERTRATVGYVLTDDDFGDATTLRPGARTTLHSMTGSFVIHATERTSLGVEHNLKLLVGEESSTFVVTRGLFWANRTGLRWSYAVTPHVTAELIAGPRFAQTVPASIDPKHPTATRWQRAPEVSASLIYRTPSRSLTVTYGRTQTLGFGASGFIDTESLNARTAWAIGHLRLSARPGVFRNTLAGLHANSYRVDALASYALSDWISVDALFSQRHQDSSLALADFAVTSLPRSRTRNRVAVGFTIRRAIRLE